MEQAKLTEAMSDAALANELARYLVLFDKLVGETGQWVAAMPAQNLEWMPPSDGGIHFGTRLRHASVKALFVHMALAGNFWATTLRDCEPEGTVPLPRDMNAFHALLDGDFVANREALHGETMKIMCGLDANILRKPLQFAGDKSPWTTMGFLWGIWGHRSYHLGNLDMLVRQRTGIAPDFFAFAGGQMA